MPELSSSQNLQIENELAKRMVLFNGVQDYWSANKGLSNSTMQMFDNRPQVRSSGPYDEGGSVGYGGIEQGFKAMPGITDIKVTPKERGGIRDITINIKAHNIRQFELLESTYLRLGYHILLEWGWSNYQDNGGSQVVRDDLYTPAFGKFFHIDGSGEPEYYSILDSILEEKKKSEGNYDAALARIYNFNWKLNPYGS